MTCGRGGFRTRPYIIGRVIAGGFQTRPYGNVVEDENTMDMIRHDHKGIEDEVWIMIWEIIPTFGRDPAK